MIGGAIWDSGWRNHGLGEQNHSGWFGHWSPRKVERDLRMDTDIWCHCCNRYGIFSWCQQSSCSGLCFLRLYNLNSTIIHIQYEGRETRGWSYSNICPQCMHDLILYGHWTLLQPLKTLVCDSFAVRNASRVGGIDPFQGLNNGCHHLCSWSSFRQQQCCWCSIFWCMDLSSVLIYFLGD